MSATEMFVVPVVIGVTILALLFGFYLLSAFDGVIYQSFYNLNETSGLDPIFNETYKNFSASMHLSMGHISTLMPVAYVLLVIVAALLAFQLRTHPAFLPIMIIAIIGAIFVANVFQTLIYEFADALNVSAYPSEDQTSLSASAEILDNLPLLTLIGGAIIIIAYFSMGNQGAVALKG